MSDKPTRVLLVRHATNDWIGKRLAGWTPGVHLNERGRAQAEALGERLASLQLAAIYSSPLERTMETAAAIASHHGNCPVQQVEGLGEVRCGDWTGQAIEELVKTDLWRQVQHAPSAFRFPNGDSIWETQVRLLKTLETLVAAHPGETIIAVSHSDPIKLAAAFFLGMPLDLFQRLVVEPASITELVFGTFGARLLRCNDTAHVPAEAEAQPKGPAEPAAQAGQPPERPAEKAAQGQ